MNVKHIPITTNSNGDYAGDHKLLGEVLAVILEIGTLSTPDVTITTTLTGEAIFAKTGIGASDQWQPRRLIQTSAGVDVAAAAGPPVVNNVYEPVICPGDVHVVVAGGGDTLSGVLHIVFRG